MSFLIYGANGYTGKLVVEQAVAKGLQPILAGRSEAEIKSLAATYNLDYRIFSLENVPKIVDQITGIKLVLNCAGPFSKTAKHLIEACLLVQAHYLDINGEVEVFEFVKEYDLQAKDNEIIILPGVGFDVVPLIAWPTNSSPNCLRPPIWSWHLPPWVGACPMAPWPRW